MGTAPGLPTLTLNLAVTGHRWDRLDPGDATAIRASATTLLNRVRSELAARAERWSRRLTGHEGPGASRVRVLSALAEGADRLVAQAGLDLGMELQVILPFPQPIYEEDFNTPASRAEFAQLLTRAGVVQTLLDHRPAESAYVPVQQALLRHADLLVAIWDGEGSRGPGGTVEIMRDSATRGIPVVVIAARSPHEIWVFNPALPDTGRSEELSRLPALLDALTAPPNPDPREGNWDIAAEYVAEPRVKGRATRFHDRLVHLLCPGHGAIAPVVAPKALAAHAERIEREWGDALTEMPPELRNHLIRGLVPAFARADGLAIYYASRYRSTFAAGYVLSALAVPVGLWIALAHAHPLPASILAGLEVAMLGMIGLLVWRGRKHRFHERWLHYRALAERVRHLAFLLPLGLAAPALSRREGSDAESRSGGWFGGWMLRGVVRALGILPGSLAREHVLAAARVLAHQELHGQIEYHDRVAGRNHVLSHRLHRVGVGLFISALSVAALDLVFYLGAGAWLCHMSPVTANGVHYLLATLTVFLPAAAAAVHGFMAQGEFANTERRSRDVRRRLHLLHDELQTDPEDRATVERIAWRTAAVLEEELDDWRAEYAGKPLEVIV